MRASEDKISRKRELEKRTSENKALKPLKLFVAITLMLALLSGCGGKDKESESNYKEVLTESEQLSDVRENVDASEREGYIYLGSQLRSGERLQIWGSKAEDEGKVYLHRENGERELLMEDVHNYFFNGFKWWVDDKDRCFLLKPKGISRPKMDEGLRPSSDLKNYEGVVFQYEIDNDEQILGICQLEDGRYIVASGNRAQYSFSEMDPDSGRMENILSFPSKDFGYLVDLVASEGNGLLVLGRGGVWDVNLTDGQAEHRVSFDGTTFDLEMDEYGIREKEDFRLLEDGRIELLWSDGTVEFLNVTDIGEDREIIVLRTNGADEWLKEQVVAFNQQSGEYCIVLEERLEENAADLEDVKSFRERTELEIGAGKGADIIASSAVNDAHTLLEKGAFADLTPFMDASGLSEEDFFPAAFSGWKDDGGTYGIRVMAMLSQFWLDQEVVGERSVSNIEEMIDCLLDYEEEAVLMKGRYYSAAGLLRFFMKYSESLCGMVDFENGSCDFSGEVFEKMLEAAKRYGYDEKKELKAIGGIVEYHNYYNFCDDEFLSKIGWVPVGFMSDDGGHPEISSYVLTINANSDRQEGAWEFLCYLLGEEAQSRFYVEEENAFWLYVHFPINRNVFEELCGRHKEVINES